MAAKRKKIQTYNPKLKCSLLPFVENHIEMSREQSFNGQIQKQQSKAWKSSKFWRRRLVDRQKRSQNGFGTECKRSSRKESLWVVKKKQSIFRVDTQVKQKNTSCILILFELLLSASLIVLLKYLHAKTSKVTFTKPHLYFSLNYANNITNVKSLPYSGTYCQTFFKTPEMLKLLAYNQSSV